MQAPPARTMELTRVFPSICSLQCSAQQRKKDSRRRFSANGGEKKDIRQRLSLSDAPAILVVKAHCTASRPQQPTLREVKPKKKRGKKKSSSICNSSTKPHSQLEHLQGAHPTPRTAPFLSPKRSIHGTPYPALHHDTFIQRPPLPPSRLH
jgi:hypothetical protein